MPGEPTSQRTARAWLVWNAYLPNMWAAAAYTAAELHECCEQLSRAALDAPCAPAR